MNESKKFSGKIGFILAAAGSAVGLGNLWRFPYLAAKYGGGTFLLIYLILTVTFGFSLMITEITIGRKTGKSVVNAFGALHANFRFIGYLAAIVPVLIFPYYCVIGGWVVRYFTAYMSGEAKLAAGDNYFPDFISQTGQPIIFLLIFIMATAIIVVFGVQKGIEKFSKILMPILIILTIGIAIYGLTIPGAAEGFIYYIKPDVSKFSIDAILAAVGQLFYSLSLAMGIMITYGSYMKKEENIESCVRHIEIFDTAIAFLAGLIIIPAIFTFHNVEESLSSSGPSLMFIVLPKVFSNMAFGDIIGGAFFALVFFAAITSSISLMETIVSMLEEKLGWSRITTCITVVIFSFALALPSTLGFGAWSDITVFGMSFLDFFDFISNTVLMPIVALLTCIFVGYVLKPRFIEEEISRTGEFKSRRLYNITIRFIAPAFLLLILITSILTKFNINLF